MARRRHHLALDFSLIGGFIGPKRSLSELLQADHSDVTQPLSRTRKMKQEGPRTFSGQDLEVSNSPETGTYVDRILVIDDDAEVQQAVSRTLEPAGYEIVTAADGGVAMDIFRATMPGLIVLDLGLPRKSGQDLCREIRNNHKCSDSLVLSAVNRGGRENSAAGAWGRRLYDETIQPARTIGARSSRYALFQRRPRANVTCSAVPV